MAKPKNQPKHLHFRQGVKVVVKMVDGSVFTDIFVRFSRHFVVFGKKGKVNVVDIAAINQGKNFLNKR